MSSYVGAHRDGIPWPMLRELLRRRMQYRSPDPDGDVGTFCGRGVCVLGAGHHGRCRC